MEVKLLKQADRTKALPRDTNVIINWGNTKPHPTIAKGWVLNNPDTIVNSTNKLKFFKMCEGKVSIPFFTIDKERAKKLIDEGNVVVVRETLAGHSGEGIVILSTIEEWNNYDHNKARMYVKYIPKKHEYRVHIIGGEVIDVRRKGIRKDVEKDDIDWQVRNHKNGFIYLKDFEEPVPNCVNEQALEAMKCSGLDFGAVDVIYNEHYDVAYVLEINTAPGLEGSSLDMYAENFKTYIERVTNG